MAKSVKDRLLNIARQEGRVFDVLLVRFALERLLYRLSVSEHRDRFVLKGGMLVTVWVEDDNRVTRDADFLGHGNPDPERLAADFREIMAIKSDDGLVFDLDALAATAIREEMEYGGTRLKTSAYLEKTRIPVTIDIGFGDAMADATQQLDYPTLLDLPAPNVRAYPPATVIAEKFQAMVALGVLNGRMKDYYDLWAIPRALDIAANDLDAAITATFERRQTAIPTERPPGLSAEMVGDESSSANGGPTRHRSSLRTSLLNRSSIRSGTSSDRRVRGSWQKQRRNNFRNGSNRDAGIRSLDIASLAKNAMPCYRNDGTFFARCRRLVSRPIGLKTRNRRR